MKLQNKFRNERKKSSSPTVSKKRACLAKAVEKSRHFRVAGVPQYCPGCEERSSVKLEQMNNRLKAGTGSEEDLTGCFPIRRCDVVEGKMSVRRLKTTYPYMFGQDAVSNYFHFCSQPLYEP